MTSQYQGAELLNLVISLAMAKLRVGNVQIKEEDVNNQTGFLYFSFGLLKS